MGVVLPSRGAVVVEPVKAEHELWTLRLSLERSGDRSLVVFAVDHGSTEIFSERIDTSALGLPDRVDDLASDRPAPNFTVPSSIVDSLAGFLRGAGFTPPLWLQFSQQCGYLAIVPWEIQLAALGAPILRLPYFALPPVVAAEPLHVVIVASAPVAKDPPPLEGLVLDTVSAFKNSVTLPCSIDVFVDAASHDGFATGFASDPLVRVPDPTGAPTDVPGATRTIPSGTAIVSPWLLWVLDTLGSQPVDIVAFVCPGYFAGDQGALALAEAPVRNRDTSLARFIGAEELTAFLRQTGAWAVQLTDVTENAWGIGLRLLVDDIARRRPGVALLRNPSTVTVAELTATWQYLLRTAGEPLASATAVYCHPDIAASAVDWASVVSTTSDFVKHAVTTFTLGDAGEVSASPAPEPAWFVSAQRYLEEQAGQLLGPTTSPGDDDLGLATIGDLGGLSFADFGSGVKKSAAWSSLSTSRGDDTLAAEAGVADALKFVAEALAPSDVERPLA